MRFHITLKDNETGETHIDEDINGIILAASTKERDRGMVITSCNAFDLAGIYNAAQEQLKKN